MFKKPNTDNGKHLQVLNPLLQTAPRRNDDLGYGPLTLSWFLGSIFFFIIARWLAPLFWVKQSLPETNDIPTTVDLLLGVSGLLAYFIEPIIWQNNVYARDTAPRGPAVMPVTGKETLWKEILYFLLSTVGMLLLSLPFSILMIFRPIFRALILYTAFSYLGWLSGPQERIWLFNVIVLLDILFYYLGMIFPRWKGNPVHAAGRLLQIADRPFWRWLPQLLLILHAAYLYTLMLNLAYASLPMQASKANLWMVSWYWVLFMAYTRLSFLPDDFELIRSLNAMPAKILGINIAIYGISYLGFLSPILFP